MIQRPRFLVLISLLFVLVCPSFAKAKQQASSHRAHAHRGAKKKRATKPGAWKRKGQHEIDEDRATAIQQALIREHYLSGSATGIWDDSTRAAMARYQADHGWQSKRIPDARALIKLGLGPSHSPAPLADSSSELAASPALPASDSGMAGPPQQ